MNETYEEHRQSANSARSEMLAKQRLEDNAIKREATRLSFRQSALAKQAVKPTGQVTKLMLIASIAHSLKSNSDELDSMEKMSKSQLIYLQESVASIVQALNNVSDELEDKRYE
jgi:hypothetical protein